MLKRTNLSRSSRAGTPSQEVIVKLKNNAPTRVALRRMAAAEGVRELSVAGASVTETAFAPSGSALEALVVSGALVAMEPLFGAPRVARAAHSERIALAVEASDDDSELDTFHVLTFHDEEEARRACMALEHDAKVEYLHTPVERYLMSRACERKSGRSRAFCRARWYGLCCARGGGRLHAST